MDLYKYRECYINRIFTWEIMQKNKELQKINNNKQIFLKMYNDYLMEAISIHSFTHLSPDSNLRITASIHTNDGN
jgi:hypothetical protein